MGALHQCHEADARKGCGKPECISCRSIKIAKRWLKRHPLDAAWQEEKFREKVYRNQAYWDARAPRKTHQHWDGSWRR